MTAVTELRAPWITEPGVYLDVSHDDYHADPVAGGSLSSTGARMLLPPGCPAKFRYRQDHPEDEKQTDGMDLGTLAHGLALGSGPQVRVVAADDWRTKAAREAKAEARLRGEVPVLAAKYVEVQAMKCALVAHPWVAKLFSNGAAEATLVWRDERTGVMCRARLDWLPHSAPGGLMALGDYKTTTCAQTDAFMRTAASFKYHQQMAWYAAGVKALGLAERVGCLLVAQEVAAPYLVNVVQLDVNAIRIGEALNRRALDKYAECTRTGVWPGYEDGHDDIPLASLPAYVENQHEGDLQ